MSRPGSDRAASRGWVLAPVVAAAIAVGITVALVSGRGDDGAPTPPSVPAVGSAGVDDGPAPVEVASDAPRFEALPDLVAASDLVVQGEVVSSVEGRWFGTPSAAGAGAGADADAGGGGGDGDGDARILSRLVTVRVTQVLAGAAPTTDTVLLEEEGWTADRAPLVVDGLAAAAVGDHGFWFLADGGDPEVGAYVLVNAQGRYLERSGRLVGAAGGDQLVAELSTLSPVAFAAAVAGSDALDGRSSSTTSGG